MEAHNAYRFVILVLILLLALLLAQRLSLPQGVDVTLVTSSSSSGSVGSTTMNEVTAPGVLIDPDVSPSAQLTTADTVSSSSSSSASFSSSSPSSPSSSSSSSSFISSSSSSSPPTCGDPRRWHVPEGLHLSGQGCGRCTAGERCSFTLAVRAPTASWSADALAHPLRREVQVVLAGPSLVGTQVEELHPMDGSLFLVSYQAWDPGFYRVFLRTPCKTLQVRERLPGLQLINEHVATTTDKAAGASADGTAEGGLQQQQQQQGEEDWFDRNSCRFFANYFWEADSPRLSSQVLAAWELTVVEPPAFAADASAVAVAAGTEVQAVLGQRPPTSCQELSVAGRWVLGERDYTWVPFPCSQPRVPPEQWVQALNDAGIFEINFVGDSHQRMLMHHMRFLMSREVDAQHFGVHEDLSYEVVAAGGGGRVKLNMWWVPGIYTSNNEFGCSMKGRTSGEPRRPALPTTSDVTILNAGYWAGAHCARPVAAFAAALPSFLQWGTEQVRAAKAAAVAVQPSLNKGGASGAVGGGRRRPPLLVYRSTTPRATDHQGCSSFTNVYVRESNAIARQLAAHAGILYFDAWQVEAVRYLDHCPSDHHYTCVDPGDGCLNGRRRGTRKGMPCKGATGKVDVSGVVGQAVAVELLHFLLHHRP